MLVLSCTAVIECFLVYFVFCIFHRISLCLVATLIYCSVHLAIQLPGCKYVIIKLSLSLIVIGNHFEPSFSLKKQ